MRLRSRRCGALVGGHFTGTQLGKPPRNLPLEDETFHTVRLIFERIFPVQLTDAQRAIEGLTEKIEKVSDDDIARILKAVDPDAYQQVKGEIEAALRRMAVDRATAAARMAGEAANVTNDQLLDMLQQANERAIAWAEHHAAVLITEIERTTREEIRELVTTAVQEGATNDELSSALQDSYAFSKGRSDRIARTETSFAENRGTLRGWEASGLVTGKSVLPDVDPCPICQANADQGVIPLDSDFQSGDAGPPFHPNCECAVLATIPEE